MAFLFNNAVELSHCSLEEKVHVALLSTFWAILYM